LLAGAACGFLNEEIRLGLSRVDLLLTEHQLRLLVEELLLLLLALHTAALHDVVRG